MTNFTLFLVIVGIYTCVDGMFRLIDWLERGDRR